MPFRVRQSTTPLSIIVLSPSSSSSSSSLSSSSSSSSSSPPTSSSSPCILITFPSSFERPCNVSPPNALRTQVAVSAIFFPKRNDPVNVNLDVEATTISPKEWLAPRKRYICWYRSPNK